MHRFGENLNKVSPLAFALATQRRRRQQQHTYGNLAICKLIVGLGGLNWLFPL